MASLLGDIRGRAFWVVLGCLVCQMGLGFGYAFGPLATDIIEEFGWTRAAFSGARAPQIFVIAFASPLVGFAVSRFGARGVLSVSVCILAGAFAGLSAIGDWWQLAAGYALIGLAVTGLGDIAVGGVVTQWVRHSRGVALGIVYTGSNLGGKLATVLAASVADATSWRMALLALGASAVVVMLPFALFAVRDRTDAIESLQREQEPSDDEPALTVAEALRTRSFWLIGFALLAFWFYLLSLLDHFVLFLVDEGLTRAAAAGHLGNAVFMGMFSKIAFGWLADRMSARRALLLDYGLLAASSLVLLALPGSWLTWVFVLLFGFSYAARDVVTPLIVSDCFGARNLAQIYGVLMLTILPGGTLGPIFTGWTHDVTGSYQLAFAAFAALNLSCIALLAAVRDERPASSQPETSPDS